MRAACTVSPKRGAATDPHYQPVEALYTRSIIPAAQPLSHLQRLSWHPAHGTVIIDLPPVEMGTGYARAPTVARR